MLANGGWDLTHILVTWTKWRAPTNASKWRMGFNSRFNVLKNRSKELLRYLSWHIFLVDTKTSSVRPYD